MSTEYTENPEDLLVLHKPNLLPGVNGRSHEPILKAKTYFEDPTEPSFVRPYFLRSASNISCSVVVLGVLLSGIIAARLITSLHNK